MSELTTNNSTAEVVEITQTADQAVKTPYLQIMLRRGLLEKAAPETQNKFTGKGNGENYILREDAEDIVATVMEVIAAKRNDSQIIVDGTPFRACQYTKVGSGCAELMNWSGLAYFDTTMDNEKEQKALVTREVVKYVKDAFNKTVADGKTVKVFAEGKVVTPDKLDTLIKGFNSLNKKAGVGEISTEGVVSKSDLAFADFNYLYQDGEIREVGTSSDGKGCAFATLLKPTCAFNSPLFGKVSEEEATKIIEQWLF